MREDIERYIRERKRSTRSTGDQITIAHAMYDQSVTPDHDGVKSGDTEDELGVDLEFNADTSLGHLEDIDLVEEFRPPGPERLAIATWLDGGEGEVVNGRVGEVAQEGIEGLVADLEPPAADGGSVGTIEIPEDTVRGVVAEEFDLRLSEVEGFLRSAADPVDTLISAAEAIEEADGVTTGDEYGTIVFINTAYRYRLTEDAIELYER